MNSYKKSISNSCMIRIASVDDARELLKIYIPYVQNTAISFEYDVPSLTEFELRITETLEKYPYIVAVSNNKIVGYAYASSFKERRAYDWSVEVSIYIADSEKHNGYGKALYLTLEELLKKQNILNLYACIAYTEAEDEYLTNDSMKFHEHMGYRFVGKFTQSGYKFGKWYDMIWMEKMLGEHIVTPKRFVPFSELYEV